MDTAENSCRDETLVNSAQLLEGLMRVSQIVRSRFNHWLEQYKLTDGRHAVLSVLAQSDQDGCSQSDLAKKIGQSESNISTLVERMARDELISRLRSVADRRKCLLQITTKGRSTLAIVATNQSAWAGRLLNAIPNEDRMKLYVLLQRLGSSLELPMAMPSPVAAESKTSLEAAASILSVNHSDSVDDPKSPQSALRQLLLALSSPAGIESSDVKGAA